MSRITDEARPGHYMRKNVKFIDGYEWQFDAQLNHRLIHTVSDKASDWVQYQSIAVLNEFLVATDVWQGLLPVNMLLRWEAIPNPS